LPRPPRALNLPRFCGRTARRRSPAGRYTADLNLTGQLHAKFRYADHTHARIVAIDTSRARAVPGVFAVVTHEDVPDVRACLDLSA
jgi:CO/xanthine dehydrogenase Mo-binding subunit